MKSVVTILGLLFCILGRGLTCHADESFPEAFNTESADTRPLSAAEAAKRMQLPEGFHVTAFAEEPHVRQPISMTTDARGRLWVAENYTYSERPIVFHPDLRDRILIFEDSDNDGRFDKRTVFWEGAQRLMSIEIGSGGVWALCLPELIFIADLDGDDVPDGQPQVMLDGFAHERGSHTVANGLRFGPDGWLYGRQGILATSLIAAPGAADNERTTVNVGIWRFHPQRKTFENVAVGTTNPWGMDWDPHGEMFFINTVIGHLWHVIPGAHYRRMTGGDLDPRIYEIIEQHADHVHWATDEVWTDVRKGVTDDTLQAGGGHAHTGLLIYQGGQWPPSWSGKLLTVNYHGKRFNVERLERVGSGFVGRREPDAFLSADPWFRGLDIIAAPDGGVFVSDWSDTGECHDNDGVHRLSGRIFKISYGETRLKPMDDLTRLDSAALVNNQLSENDWLARMSRRVLADRAARGLEDSSTHAELNRVVHHETHPVHRLRALWALHVIGRADPVQLRGLISDPNENIRAWAIRLLEDQSHIDPTSRHAFLEFVRERLSTVARQEPSGLVRLAFASLLQKLPATHRFELATSLLSHAEDEGDHNQPLMLWYGIMPLAELSDGKFERLVAEASIPLVQRFGARRLAEELDESPERLDNLLSTVADRNSPVMITAVLDGITDGLSGRRQALKPPSWDVVCGKLSAAGDATMQDRLRALSALFGDEHALEALRLAALQSDRSLAERESALRTLIDTRAPTVHQTCYDLLEVPGLAITAASGLALSDDPQVADRLLALWPSLERQEKSSMMNILVSRPVWIPQVLDAVADGRLAREYLGAVQVRQIREYKDLELSQRLEAIVGTSVTPTSGLNDVAIANWKKRLGPEVLARADKANGRVVFQTSCAICHRLNGEGSHIGPDLTGAARDNINYLLDNILSPSAVLAPEYRQVTILLDDGRVLVGTVKSGTNKTVKVQTTTELISLSLDEIQEQAVAPISMMPEGLLDVLDENKVRDLIAYLMAKETPQR